MRGGEAPTRRWWQWSWAKAFVLSLLLAAVYGDGGDALPERVCVELEPTASTSRNRWGRNRSQSFPGPSGSWDIDEVLPAGHRNSRESVEGIPAYLEGREDEIKRLQDELKFWKTNHSDLEQRSEASKADLEKKVANLEKTVVDLEASKADSEKVAADLEKKVADLEASKADSEKVVAGLEKKLQGETRKREGMQSQVAALDLERCADLRQLYLNFINYFLHINEDLMSEARRKFSKVFYGVCNSQSFTGMIKTLVNQGSTPDSKRKLDCLRDVSSSYNWSKHDAFKTSGTKFGEQFFVMCRLVPEWNKSKFHPKTTGMRRIDIMNLARNGSYTIGGEDLNEAAMVLCHSPS